MSKTGKIISKSFKALIYLVVVIVNAIVLWRVLFSGDPSSIKPILANEHTVAAYEQHGKNLKIHVQEQRTISSSGKFSVTDCVFIPEAKQIQITVRYNNSTLKHLKNDYALSTVPDRKNELFDITIVKTTDLTPDNPNDNTDKSTLSEQRFHPSGEAKSAYKTLYSYRKFIFDGITYEDAVGMFVDIYYIEDADYSHPPYDALCIYDALMPIEEKSLSGSDIRAIKNYSKKN